MTDFMADYFGPLDKTNCVYFLIICAIFFILLVFSLFANILWVIKNYKQLNFRIFTGGVLMLFNLFIAYFVNRLLYSMCNKSLA
jgi:hypothetical protein